MTAEIPRLFLTRDEAAKACGVSLDTIRRAIGSGRLRAKRTGKEGGKHLIRVADLEDWFSQLEDA
jgi:excisionase family DNA binding protein